MLHHLHASRGGERISDVCYIGGAQVWKCVPEGSTKVVS